MLPYRLRPPVFASQKVKDEMLQQHDTEDAILAGGGPIQRAMEADLLELRPKFIRQLESISAPPQQHMPAGEAFKCFKQVFGQAKVALVHTRTVPPRSDRGAYTQLLYSACLSLLKRTFATSDDNDTWLQHAAYCIFCSYALYETSPLPSEPSEPLQLLPMGLQHPDNPKFLYRRTFKSPIRIDRYHYSLLQRICDEALARQAECTCRQMKAWESRLANNNNDGASEFSCTCSVSIDVVQVIDRLLPNLELAEYTGPVGLEALAGHADYPYGAIRPKKKSAVPLISTEPSVHKHANEALDAIAQEQGRAPRDDTLQASLDDYNASLKAIRPLPATASSTNQVTRTRNALKPIFDQPSGRAMEDKVSTNDAAEFIPGQSEHEAEPDASTQVMEPVLESQDGVRTSDGFEEAVAVSDAHKEVPRTSALDDLSCHLVFPSNLAEAQQDAIRAALDAALESGDIRIDSENEASKEQGSSASENALEEDADSADGSDGIGVGAAALRDLLLQASAKTSFVNGPGEDHEASISARNFGSSFLTPNLDSTFDGKSLSDDPSVSSQDSMAGPGVGGMSLAMLWSTVGQDGKQPARRKRKRKRAASLEEKAKLRKSRPSQSRQRSKVGRDVLSDESEDSSIDNDVGLSALQLLLSSVRDGDNKEAGGQQGEPRKRKRKRNMSSGDGVQRKRRQQKSESESLRGKSKQVRNDDPPSMSSEDSTQEDFVSGQAALQTLLSAVEGSENGEDLVRNEDRLHSSERPPQKHGLDVSESSDDDSVLSDSPGPGKAALGALLALASQR